MCSRKIIEGFGSLRPIELLKAEVHEAALDAPSDPILEAVAPRLRRPVLTMDGSGAGDELRSAFLALDEAHETLKTAWAECRRGRGPRAGMGEGASVLRRRQQPVISEVGTSSK